MDSPNYVARRRRALAAAAKQVRVHGFVVTRPEDVRYLTGFGGDDSFVLLARGQAVLITDGRFAEQAAKECPGVELHVRKASIYDAVAQEAKRRRLRRLAVQGGHMTLAAGRVLEAALGNHPVVPVGDVVGQLRQIKDAYEIRLIRKAVRAAEKGFLDLMALGAKGWIGRTERHLAAELDYRMRLAGADGPSFETIVAEGPHASLPHYRPGGYEGSAGQLRPDRLGGEGGGLLQRLDPGGVRRYNSGRIGGSLPGGAGGATGRHRGLPRTSRDGLCRSSGQDGHRVGGTW